MPSRVREKIKGEIKPTYPPKSTGTINREQAPGLPRTYFQSIFTGEIYNFDKFCLWNTDHKRI